MRYNILLLSGMLLGLLCTPACDREADELADSASDGQVVVQVSMDRTPGVKSVTSQIPAVSEKGDTLYMHAVVSDAWPEELTAPDTRASLTQKTDFDSGSSGTYMGGFGLSMFAADGTALAQDVKYIKNGTVWKAEGTPAYWQADATPKVKFYAYAPYGAAALSANGKLTGTIAHEGSDDALTWDAFSINSDNASQVDLLVASQLSTDGNGLAGNSNTSLNLTFKHALTAVRFATNGGLISGDVTDITIKNVYGQGNFTFSSATTGGNNIGTWVPTGSPMSSYSLSLNKAVTFASSDYLTDADQYFLMMPQILSSNSSAQVEITIDGTKYTYNLSACTEVPEWKPGYTVTYYLSTAGLTATGHITLAWYDPPMPPYNDDRDMKQVDKSYVPNGVTTLENLCVKSYKKTSGVIQPLEWRIEVSTDGNNWSPIGGTGSIADDYLDAEDDVTGDGVDDENYWESIPDGAIHINGSVGTGFPDDYSFGTLPSGNSSSNPYNLATGRNGYDMSGANTANCYVVNASGWYCIPLVWGNALLNSVPNPSSGYAAAPFSTLTRSKVYISQAWGSENGSYSLTNPSVKLVWKERTVAEHASIESYVSDVQLTGDKKFIVFQVKNTDGKLADGNALIGLYDNSQYVWAWHIWITDQSMEPVSNGQYSYLNYNLGELKPATYNYMPEGHAYIRAKSINDPECSVTSNVIKVYNLEQPGEKRRGVLQYQWGSHIPFLQNNSDYYSTLSLNIQNGPQNDLVNYSSVNLAEAFPHTFYKQGSGDDATRWGAVGGVTAPAYKTILDPSPYGYRVPSITELISLVANDGSEVGDYAYKFSPKSGSTTLQVSKSFVRQASDGVNETETKINLWSANVMSAGSSYGYYSANPAGTITTTSIQSGNALAVKPVRDDMVNLTPGMAVKPFDEEGRYVEWGNKLNE